MKELLIQQKLDEVDQEVVRRAEAVVDNAPGITKELDDKQIRNIIAVADDTQSIAVVDNFIKYQIGRSYDEKKPNQKWCFLDKNRRRFGEAIRMDLEWIQKLAKSNTSGEVTADELSIRLTRRYLGYLMRHFKYVDAQSEK
jgi:hypothetical protein